MLKQARYPGASQKAQQIVKRLQQPCLQASEVITRTKSRLMLALVNQLEPLLKQIAEYDKEIERLFLIHADSELFSTLPGAGARLAPRLLAEMGDDRSRYADASSLQALAGTSPVLFQSGTYQKAHRRLGCIKPWRNALHQFAWQSTHQEAWAKEYYQRKRARARATPSRSARWPMSGRAFSTPSGRPSSPITPRPLKRLDGPMRCANRRPESMPLLTILPS